MAHFRENFFSKIWRKFIFFELGELFTCENEKFCVDAPQALYPWSKFGPHRLRFRYLFGQKKLFSPLQPGESVRRSYKYYIRQIGQIILTTESVDAGDILLNNIPLPYRKRSNNNQLFVARKNIKAQSTDLLQRLQPLELASSTSDDLLSIIFTSGQYLSTIYALCPAGLRFPIVQTLHTNKYYAALKSQ